MIVEVESNDNCETSFFGRFKEAGPARPVNQVKLYDQNPTGEWYWITGWSDDEQTPACQAYAQLVEDSGAGLTHLNGEKPTCRSPVTVICVIQNSFLRPCRTKDTFKGQSQFQALHL